MKFSAIFTIILLAACLITCCFFSFWLKGFTTPMVNFNSSLFGLFLASLFPAAISYSKSKKVHLLLFAVLVSSIVYFQSRAALVGLLVGVFVFIYLTGCLNRYTLAGVIVLVSSILLIIVGVTFLFKAAFTSGRWFIWKNSMSLILEKPIVGYGISTFKNMYSNEQMRWFQRNGFDTKEALLADTVYYSFNEWLQMAVQIGVPITCFLLFAILALFIRSIFKIKNSPNAKFEKAVISSFAVLLCGTFLSYPFYYLPTLFLFLFSSLYLLHIVFKDSVFEKFTSLIIASIMIVVAFYFYNQVSSRLLWKEASELSKISYKMQAKEKMLQAYPVLKQNGDFLYSLGVLYSSLEQKDSAFYFLNKAVFYKNDYELHKKLGQLYFEANNNVKAEQHFLKAVYMVPNRFRSREALIDFYIKTGEQQKALEWSVASLKFPIKIPSDQVFKIRRRFELFLQTEKW